MRAPTIAGQAIVSGGALLAPQSQLENLMQRIDAAWLLFSLVGRKAVINQCGADAS
jgi:hypothetical protein